MLLNLPPILSPAYRGMAFLFGLLSGAFLWSSLHLSLDFDHLPSSMPRLRARKYWGPPFFFPFLPPIHVFTVFRTLSSLWLLQMAGLVRERFRFFFSATRSAPELFLTILSSPFFLMPSFFFFPPCHEVHTAYVVFLYI